jgi:N-glycosylase/DNA lyase
MKLLKYFIDHNEHIDLENTLFSGQSFMWNKLSCSTPYYYRIFDNNFLLISQINDGIIEVQCTSNKLGGLSISDFIKSHLSLDIEIENVFRTEFEECYPDVWALLHRYRSVRVMRQDPFETMVTFMCAQGIGMGMIRRQVSMITERYGDELEVMAEPGQLRGYTFPSPSVLATADLNELARCTNNNRIRATNIIRMARSFESGSMAFACVQSGECPLDTLRETLCAHGGIGLKIADCIALFGLGRLDAFPIDTHVRQYLREWFGIESASRSLTERNYRYLQEEARNMLGEEYAGYAGHILFHCWRKEIRKMTTY